MSAKIFSSDFQFLLLFWVFCLFSLDILPNLILILYRTRKEGMIKPTTLYELLVLDRLKAKSRNPGNFRVSDYPCCCLSRAQMRFFKGAEHDIMNYSQYCRKNTYETMTRKDIPMRSDVKSKNDRLA